MRNKFCFLLLIPVLLSLTSCQSGDKLTFSSGKFVFDTYYNDNYFLLDNKNVHEEIALASHAMALSTFKAGDDYQNKSQYLKELWEKEGFHNLYFNDYFYVKPETDSIAFGIASKSIKDFTLIAIAVRGGFYEAEWTSNFTLGESGNSKGFDEASDKVVAGFDQYVTSNNINGHVKIWISGFSRAAITSNMTAGKLLNRTVDGEYSTDNYNYSVDDIYAYCFEPPMGVEATLEEARAPLYQGIHNFINYNDLVPLVAPYEWGFVRYGTDHYYPDRLNDIHFESSEREKMLSLYHFTYGADKFHDYTVDKWRFFDVGATAPETYIPIESIHPSLGRFTRALVYNMALSGFGSRNLYFNEIENGLRNIIAAVFGCNPQIEKINPENIIDIIFEYSFIRNIFLELQDCQNVEFATDMQLLLFQIFGANKNNIDAIQDLYMEVADFFYYLPDTFRFRKDILAQLLYRDNATSLFIGHQPELSYCFLSSCDSRFLGSDKCEFNDGTYYILHLTKPTSFTLYEENLKQTIFEYKNDQMISGALSAERYIDGTIDIYLPKNGVYAYLAEAENLSLLNVDPLMGESILESSLPKIGEIK